MKKLAVVGSTGSVGRQALEVVGAFPDRFEVVGLACGRNTPLLEEQVARFKPKLVFCESRANAERIPGVAYVSAEDIASHPDVDLVVVATSGKAGLEPTLAGIRAGKTIALANKEVLVAAGEIVTAEACRHGVEILPLDSEHSAIWQCLRGEAEENVARLVLTASGGPFRRRSRAELADVTPQEALNHPTWRMGAKVTVDSATLMNKGLEVIEAHWLFNVPYERIDVVVHPECIIHSLVEFVDGSAKAQLSSPDMMLPIQCALTYPERWEATRREHVDLVSTGSLNFEPLDWERFPCPGLAIEAGKKGGTYPAVLSAADEVAVQLFLDGRIGFLDIARVVSESLERHQSVGRPSLEDILAADVWARETANSVFSSRA